MSGSSLQKLTVRDLDPAFIRGKRALVREPGPLLGSLGWSPDATRLAFMTVTATGKSRLYVVGPGGGKARRLSEAVALVGFAWQP